MSGAPLRAVATLRFAVALDVQQGRLVMEALAARPFREVFELIGRLNAWAGAAFAISERDAGAPFALTQAELALVIEALGELPYRRVHVLVGSLQSQLDALLAQVRHG
ncbi:MAG: hypothetical protein ACLGI6_22515 [Gammaproteobacteria bacterium]